jgi:hypothetical protein
VPGATDKKYVTDFKATLLPVKSNWEIPEQIDDSEFDYSWVPDPREYPLIWEFGTQWQINGGPKYIALKSEQIKLHSKKYTCFRVVNNSCMFPFEFFD